MRAKILSLLILFLFICEQALFADPLGNWQLRNSRTTNDLYGITYGNDIFVAVGRVGIILTSQDGGETWTSRTSGTINTLVSVIYGNSKFVAVGENGTILTSPDGNIWTSETSGTSRHLIDITYSKNMFVIAVGEYGILALSNGNWTKKLSGTNWLKDIAYGNNNFVVIGYSDTILTSEDGGEIWTSRDSGTTNEKLNDITYSNNKFVIVGSNGTIQQSG